MQAAVKFCSITVSFETIRANSDGRFMNAKRDKPYTTWFGDYEKKSAGFVREVLKVLFLIILFAWIYISPSLWKPFSKTQGIVVS